MPKRQNYDRIYDMNISSRSSDIVKMTQILRYLLSFDDNGKMNRTKLIKLLWAADRYHMRHYGRLVSDSNYVAMKFGPVSSLALDIAQVKNDFALDKDDIEYVEYYLSADNENTMATAASIEEDHLSETDKEALKWAWDTFGDREAFDIANNVSHLYPEWAQFEDFFVRGGGRGRRDIDPIKFFDNPEHGDEFFNQDADQLAAARELYIDDKNALATLGTL